MDGYIPSSGILDLTVVLILIWGAGELPGCFPQTLHHLTFPPPVREGPAAQHLPQPALLPPSLLFNDTHPSGCEVHPTVVLIRSPLMVRGTEPLICLL